MSELVIKEKEIVVPGQVLAKGMDYLPSYGTYRKDEEIHASMLGLAQVNGKVIKLIPLSGKYNPKKNDKIIAKVVDILFAGWRLDINCGTTAVLSPQEASSNFIERGADLSKYFDIDEYLYCMITNVTSQKLVDVTMKGPGMRKLQGGRIIEITPNKVPRVIGKQGSMVTQLKEATGSQISVGQNGRIWIMNEDPEKEISTVEAIYMIEKFSHISGLTDRVNEFLKSKGLVN